MHCEYIHSDPLAATFHNLVGVLVSCSNILSREKYLNPLSPLGQLPECNAEK